MFNFDKTLKMMQAVDWLYLGKPVTMKDIKLTADLVVYKARINKATTRTGALCVLIQKWNFSL